MTRQNEGKLEMLIFCFVVTSLFTGTAPIIKCPITTFFHSQEKRRIQEEEAKVRRETEDEWLKLAQHKVCSSLLLPYPHKRT